MRHSVVVYRLCIDSMMAALYVILAYFALRIGNITFTPASICILLVALLYEPSEAVLVAALGEMLNQAFKYGFGPTTVLWMLPAILRAVIVSLVAVLFRRRGTYLEEHTFWYYFTLISASLVVTAANTGVIYLDAYIYQYPAEYTAFETLYRFLTSLGTSIVVATILLPVMRALNHVDIGRVKKKQPENIEAKSLQQK